MSSVRQEQLRILSANSANTVKLDRLLRQFYETRIRNKPIGNIRQSTEADLTSIINRFMIESYDQAANEVNSKFKALPFYDLTVDDISAINNTERIIIDKFYHKIEEVETRNQGLEFGDVVDVTLTVTGEVKQKNELDPWVYINAVATGVIFGASNLARTNVPSQIIQKVEPAKAQKIQERYVWKYLTRGDPFVCDDWERACKPLHNRTFEFNDPNLPNPPFDRHLHCRCIMVIVKA